MALERCAHTSFGPPNNGRRQLSHVRVAVLALTPTDLTVDSLKASALFNLIAPPLHMVGLGGASVIRDAIHTGRLPPPRLTGSHPAGAHTVNQWKPCTPLAVAVVWRT